MKDSSRLSFHWGLDGRENGGTKDSCNFGEGQSIAMDNHWTGRIITRNWGSEGLLFYSRDWGKWHQDSGEGIHDPIGLDAVIDGVFLLLFDEFDGLMLVMTWFFFNLH